MRTLNWKDVEHQPATPEMRDEMMGRLTAIFVDALVSGELLVMPPRAVLLLQSANEGGQIAPNAPATFLILIDGHDLSLQAFGFVPWHVAHGRFDYERMARDTVDARKLGGRTLHQSL